MNEYLGEVLKSFMTGVGLDPPPQQHSADHSRIYKCFFNTSMATGSHIEDVSTSVCIM